MEQGHLSPIRGSKIYDGNLLWDENTRPMKRVRRTLEVILGATAYE